MGKKNKAFNPPVRTPQVANKIWSDMVLKKVAAGELVELLQGVLIMSEKTYSDKIDGASNDAFNLALCGAFIGARDMGMCVDEIKELAHATFSVFDDMGDDLARIQEATNIVDSFGIKVVETAKQNSDENRKMMAQKTSVFYLLEHGTTEIEDILEKCKQHNIEIDYRDACAIRWEYNRKKYYEGVNLDMSKSEQAFDLLDKNSNMTASELAEKLDVKRETAYQYKYLWKKNKGEDAMAKQKAKAIEMVKNGASVEDLVNGLGITADAAQRYIDKFNEEKNGGEIEIMTDNMKKAFELFDKAHSEKQVADLLDLGRATVHNYYTEWIRINKRDLSTDEMSEILTGADEGVVILKHKGVLKGESGKNDTEKKAKKHFEADKAGKANESADQTEKDSAEAEREEPSEGNHDDAPEVHAVNDPQWQDTQSYEYHEMSNGLKKKVKVVEVVSAIEGQFATYIPVADDTFDIEIDGQVITINRDAMKTLGQELLTVADAEL